MSELNKEELLSIEGGASCVLTGTLISTYIKGATLYYEFGKSLGTSIKKVLLTCTYCL